MSGEHAMNYGELSALIDELVSEWTYEALVEYRATVFEWPNEDHVRFAAVTAALYYLEGNDNV